MGDISKNFSFSEFEYSRKAKENGIDNSIPSDAIRESIRLLVQTILQPLRDALEAPLHVNSGYRCEKLNILVNGQKDCGAGAALRPDRAVSGLCSCESQEQRGSARKNIV